MLAWGCDEDIEDSSKFEDAETPGKEKGSTTGVVGEELGEHWA